MSQLKLLKIAVGVVINSQHQVLIALRPQQVDQGGLWEFPGGKIEVGETAYQALCRELKEEININVHAADRLIDVDHTYPTHQVILHTFLVSDYSGDPVGLEGQPLQWVAIENLDQINLPAANTQIVSALKQDIFSF